MNFQKSLMCNYQQGLLLYVLKDNIHYTFNFKTTRTIADAFASPRYHRCPGVLLGPPLPGIILGVASAALAPGVSMRTHE